jgi:Reverse transcriptase (RNA-dependent DNA polymerase)
MQHAYRKGKSTETALHELVYQIESSISGKKSALGVFLDIEGAFDNTTFETIGSAAEEHSVQPTLNRWVDVILRTRIIYVVLRGEIVHMSVASGCPQGGVLSILLWNMVVLNDSGNS